MKQMINSDELTKYCSSFLIWVLILTTSKMKIKKIITVNVSIGWLVNDSDISDYNLIFSISCSSLDFKDRLIVFTKHR